MGVAEKSGAPLPAKLAALLREAKWLVLVGDVAGLLLAAALGFTGATLLLLTLGAIGLSLFTGISWVAAAETVGAALESAYGLARRAWERRQDRKLGELAREERDFVVE